MLSNHRWRRPASWLTALLMLALLAALPPALQAAPLVGPALAIADATIDASFGSFSAPVVFTSNGANVASVAFSLDYDNCVSFDATDSDNDGIPDAITGLPAGFGASVVADATDTDGELDISVYDDTSPISTLSDGTLLTVKFGVVAGCMTTDGVTTKNVVVNFSSAPAPSFGDPNAVDVTGSATGGTFTLSFNGTPTDITFSGGASISIDENTAAGTAVGTFSTADPDGGDTHTYSLVAGDGDDDNAAFTFDGNTLKIVTPPDFETKSTLSVRIRTTDNGGLNGTFDKVFTITINDVYEAPAGVNFSGGGDDGDPNTLDIDENKPAGSTLADFSPSNPNAGSTYTYTLVSGTGDDDNGSFTFNGSQLQSTEPLDAEKPGGYTIRVKITDDQGNSHEEVFTVIANDVNDAPVAQNDAVDPRTTVLVGAASLNISVLDNDSDQDNDPLTVGALTQPGAGAAIDNNTNITFTAPNSNGTASFTYKATDGSLNSAAATVTVSHVKNDPRGDCNGSGSVTAADFTAVALEIFDSGSDPQVGNKPAWWRIYAGGYAGSPIGCDANASKNGANNTADSVSAADIICSVLVFFGYTDCTQPVPRGRAGTAATLAAPQALAAQPGASVDVPLSLEGGGNAIAAAAFSLRLDAPAFHFDATDADGDGVPDAVILKAPDGMNRTVLWNPETQRLDVALYGVSLPAPTLKDGTVAVVRLTVDAGAPAGSAPLVFERVSLGDAAGQDVTAQAVDGSLTIGPANAGRIFLPFVYQ